MTIIYIVITRNKKSILCEFTEYNGNFQQISLHLLNKLHEENVDMPDDRKFVEKIETNKINIVSNFSVIGGASNLGEFAITYELRSGSTAGVNVLGFPVTLNTTSGIISITSIPSSSLPAGTYFFVLTGFASNVSATLNNPAPGSYAMANASATLAAIPTNYLINIRYIQ